MSFLNLKGGGEVREGQNKGRGEKKQTRRGVERETTKSPLSILPKVTQRLNKVKYIA